MIIDYTYFKGKILLPQIGNTEGRTLVEQFVDDYEPEYLKRVLGYDLWKAFTDGTVGSGVPDQRWTDLLSGKEFTFDGRTYKWPGFETKPSPISQYVYYQFMHDKATDNTLAGPATQAVDNNNRVNGVEKMMDAWNVMVDLNVLLWNFLYTNRSVYPEWKPITLGYYGAWYWPESIGYVHENGLFNLKNSLDL